MCACRHVNCVLLCPILTELNLDLNLSLARKVPNIKFQEIGCRVVLFGQTDTKQRVVGCVALRTRLNTRQAVVVKRLVLCNSTDCSPGLAALSRNLLKHFVTRQRWELQDVASVLYETTLCIYMGCLRCWALNASLSGLLSGVTPPRDFLILLPTTKWRT